MVVEEVCSTDVGYGHELALLEVGEGVEPSVCVETACLVGGSLPKLQGLPRVDQKTLI